MLRGAGRTLMDEQLSASRLASASSTETSAFAIDVHLNQHPVRSDEKAPRSVFYMMWTDIKSSAVSADATKVG